MDDDRVCRICIINNLFLSSANYLHLHRKFFGNYPEAVLIFTTNFLAQCMYLKQSRPFVFEVFIV
jgi:hypothetical protein